MKELWLSDTFWRFLINSIGALSIFFGSWLLYRLIKFIYNSTRNKTLNDENYINLMNLPDTFKDQVQIGLILKNTHKIDFIIANGENAAYDANGITINTSKKLFNIGIDVLTSGNHIWDKKEILEYIRTEKRLLRPLNMSNSLPGIGINIFEKKGKKRHLS